MTHRKLREALIGYRIGDPSGEFPIWDDGGAKRAAGRWHDAGSSVIYASQHYSTAMLEKLVHYGGHLPHGQCFIEIIAPAGTSYEVVSPDIVPGWDSEFQDASRAFGRTWYSENRSALLIVPSIVARMEQNIIFNTRHTDFPAIRPGLETPVWWDARLFR